MSLLSVLVLALRHERENAITAALEQPDLSASSPVGHRADALGSSSRVSVAIDQRRAASASQTGIEPTSNACENSHTASRVSRIRAC